MIEEGAIEPDEPKPDRFMQHERMKFPSRERVTPSHMSTQQSWSRNLSKRLRKFHSSQSATGFTEKTFKRQDSK